jgi:hypothetical protein
VNWDRVFGGIASATFGVQLVSLLVLLAETLVFLLIISGIWGLAINNLDILIFFLLLGGGATFLVFIWLLGAVLRLNGRIRQAIIGRGLGNLAADNSATKSILALFAVATLFVLCAGVYGYYLLWKYFLNSWGQAFLTTFGLFGQPLYEWGMIIAYIAFGALVVCIVVQVLSVMVNRAAGRLVGSVK